MISAGMLVVTFANLVSHILTIILRVNIAHEALPAAMRTNDLLLPTSRQSRRLEFVTIICCCHNQLVFLFILCEFPVRSFFPYI